MACFAVGACDKGLEDSMGEEVRPEPLEAPAVLGELIGLVVEDCCGSPSKRTAFCASSNSESLPMDCFACDSRNDMILVLFRGFLKLRGIQRFEVK